MSDGSIGFAPNGKRAVLVEGTAFFMFRTRSTVWHGFGRGRAAIMAAGPAGSSKRFVGRGGEKLDSALDAFDLDVAGVTAVDLGANVGGFTDCLLQRGAGKVFAVETGYGVLEWKLRNDPRVVVMERTNALHVELPAQVDLAVVDVGWTPMRLILPKALTLVAPGGRVCALLKPQYEADRALLKGGVVPAGEVEELVARTIEDLQAAGLTIHGRADSPITGAGGNREFFLLLIREG